MTATMTPQELAQRHAGGEKLELIDVRTPGEFAERHIPFAHNVPLGRLDVSRIATEHAGASLYVICRSGGRGKQACQRLAAAGVSAANIEGGTLAWEAAGLPLVRGPVAMSLERQVRIAAGLLVVLGAALGYFVHPYWIGLAAFIGAGLVYAGITDSCGMGMLLLQMPWNQGSSANCEAECAGACKLPGG
jgi:rhodanese-related sulfurtransferase